MARPNINPLGQPDRVAVAGDWHGDPRWAVKAIEYAAGRGAQTVLHTGDFGYQFRPHFLTAVDRALAAAGIPLLFADGNHDDQQWLARWPVSRNGLRQLTDRIWHIPRGFRWRWHGLKFTGLGGAHSVDGMYRRRLGHMWQLEERITEQQATMVKGGGHTDILLAHDCPAGVPIPGLHPEDFPQIEILRAEEHRALMREIVNVIRPRAIWHGHYHVRYRNTAQFGYGPVMVNGLDCNNSALADNIHVVDLADLQEGLPERAC